jgi:PQQ-dependent catabolism-associated CXXCW motif protein
MTGRRAAAALFLALTPFVCGMFVCGAVRGDEAAPEPPGYRDHDYRATTPATLAGARVVTTDQAEALWRDGAAIFVDVLPRAPRPLNLPPGTIWRDRPRANIPGSIWLPDTGYGELAPSTESYLRRNIERITGGARMKLLVIYCLRDCWMSWNAAKRVLAMGYVNVAWYPEGTDGWADALLPVTDAQPAPAGNE